MNQCYGTKEIENQPRLKNFNLKIILTCSKYNIQYMGQEQYSDWINLLRYRPGEREGGYCHIWAIQVCAALKGMVFKQFTLGRGT